MAKSVSYAVASRETNIIPRAIPRNQYHPEGLYARGMILVSRDDTAYDTDFAIFYALYHIFKQESIQGRGTIKGRGMIKGMHLALYQIF